MNILVLDCAVSAFSIGIESEKGQVFHTYNMGMRQSELIVPSLQNTLSEAEISVKDIQYSAVTIGPGSFTGLRLGLSALKALTFAYDIPVYGISTLKMYSRPLINTEKKIISCIDANKDKFYCSVTKGTEELLLENDYQTKEIIDFINSDSTSDEFWICGPDRNKLKTILENECKGKSFFAPSVSFNNAQSLLEITKEMIEQKKEPLKDFEGPVYLRASEAELKLENKI